MGFADWFKAEPPPPAVESATPLPMPMPGRTSAEKIDFHIARFQRALEQCVKGPRREAELQRNLDYWLAQKAALDMLSEE